MTENYVTQDNCLAWLSKPRDAEQLPLRQNFQIAPHNYQRFLYSFVNTGDSPYLKVQGTRQNTSSYQ